MQNTLKYIFLLICLGIMNNIYAQTQEDLQNILNESTEELKDRKKNKKKEESKTNKKETKEKKVETLSELDLKVEEVIKKKQKLKGSVAKYKKKGDRFEKSGSYYDAMNSYQMALLRAKSKKKIAKISLLAGESAFKVRDYVLAENYFQNCIDQARKKSKFDIAYFQLANSLKHQAKYEDAKMWYGTFMQKAEDNSSLNLMKSKARIASKGCTYAMELDTTDPAFEVLNPGTNINGPYADFGPEVRGTELIYSKIYSACSEENQSIAKLYSSLMYNEKYNLSQDFSKSLNASEDFICNPSFSKDGKTIYFSQCQMQNKAETRCQIYRSELQNGIWSKAEKLPNGINEEGSSSTQPQIIEDEQGNTILYFVSNRESGRGGKDIWFAYLNSDGSFGRVRNMGYVNTRFDEVSPFYHTESQTLFYSSDGEIGLGGLDIFSITKAEDSWSEPVNLETPINSSLDDYDFILDSKAERGFIVSNRVGTTTHTSPTCCDDIFEVRSTQIELYLSSLVYIESEGSRELLTAGTLVLEELSSGNKDTLDIIEKNMIMPLIPDGAYLLSAFSDGHESSDIQFNTLGLTRSDTLHYDLFLKAKEPEKPKNFLGIIYYEYSQARLTPEAPETLRSIIEFLEENPKTMIEVSAHTDSKGPAKFNLDLSKKRCEAAVNFLKFEGIEMFRIKKKWYGEEMPAAPNTNEDGSDNPEGRALNRRTEFKISSSSN